MSDKQTVPTDQTNQPTTSKDTTEVNLYVFDKSSASDWQAMTSQNNKRNDDPTCGGALAAVAIDFSADDLVPVKGGDKGKLVGDTLDFFQKTKPGADVPEKSFVSKLADKVADEALKTEVAGLLKDFGSEDYQTREKAEKAAKKLGPKALEHLQEGMKSEDPEVRVRTDRVLRAIKGAHLDKCLKGVNELFKDFTDMSLDDKLTPELRKKFEEKIKMADNLGLSKEDLDLADKLYKGPEPGDPNFIEKLFEKSRLKEAANMPAETRLKYAHKLAKSADPADQKQAIELLTKAIKLPGWESCPGLIKDAVENLGGVDKMPKEIQEAYKASLERIKRYERELRPGGFEIFPVRPERP